MHNFFDKLIQRELTLETHMNNIQKILFAIMTSVLVQRKKKKLQSRTASKKKKNEDNKLSIMYKPAKKEYNDTESMNDMMKRKIILDTQIMNLNGNSDNKKRKYSIITQNQNKYDSSEKKHQRGQIEPATKKLKYTTSTTITDDK